MNHFPVKGLFLCILLIAMPKQLFAQGANRALVALIPLWGSDEVMISQFGEELYNCVNGMRHFRPRQINMADRPSDVPPQGFPPHLSPSPSLTRDAPYAMTGELSRNEESGMWRLRLYLWQMSNGRLIASDEINAFNRNDFGVNLPGIVVNLFRWVSVDRPSRTVIDPKWVYIGMRGGGNLRINSPPSSWESDERYMYNYYEGFNAGMHIYFELLPFMGIQLEGIITQDYQPFDALSLQAPALLRCSFRAGGLAISPLGGIYFNFPLDDNVTYEPANLMGYTVGFSFGSKAGAGILYLDLRWASDLGDTIEFATGEGYRRNMVSISIGYEIGLFNKK